MAVTVTSFIYCVTSLAYYRSQAISSNILIFTLLKSYYGAVSTVAHKQTEAAEEHQAVMCYFPFSTGSEFEGKKDLEHWNHTGI